MAFAERPCAEALDYIENPAMTPEGVGNMSMAFGYLLGFQAANGGDLSGESETVLQRITADVGASHAQSMKHPATVGNLASGSEH